MYIFIYMWNIQCCNMLFASMNYTWMYDRVFRYTFWCLSPGHPFLSTFPVPPKQIEREGKYNVSALIHWFSLVVSYLLGWNVILPLPFNFLFCFSLLELHMMARKVSLGYFQNVQGAWNWDSTIRSSWSWIFWRQGGHWKCACKQFSRMSLMLVLPFPCTNLCQIYKQIYWDLSDHNFL